MLQFNGKQLHELNLKEILEYEKMVLKKMIAASNAGMSSTVTDQIQFFLEDIRFTKAKLMREEYMEKAEEPKELIIGEPIEQELPDSNE